MTRKPSILAALLMAGLLSGGSATALQTDDGQATSDQEFFIGSGTDIPLMPGLEEEVATRVQFDKAEGRILETRLYGRVGLAAARAFYHDALTQLGWESGDRGADVLEFSREGERLVLELEARGDEVEVRVFLRPAS